MAFSLSPGVITREYNLTGYVPNLPTARTGMVLRANQGPCLEVTPITNENELVSVFGYPDSSNYQDWFQAWNFLQYASSLYVSRPTDSNVTNAGISLVSTKVSNIWDSNLYNLKQAENTLANMSTPADPICFYKKDVTSEQRDAVAICSKPNTYNNPIGLEFYIIFDPTTDINEDNKIDSLDNTLIKGSQVLFNNNKLLTVQAVSINGSTSTVIFDSVVTSADVVPAYFTSTSSASKLVSGANVYYLTVDKASFKGKIGSYFKLGNNYYISGYGNDPNNSNNLIVYLTDTASSTVTPSVTSNNTYYSNSMCYYGITSAPASAGDTILKLKDGFIAEVGQTITFYDLGSDTYIITSIDNLNNQITISSPLAINIPTGTGIFNTVDGYYINNNPLITLVGKNYFDQIYDDSVIIKTKTNVKVPVSANSLDYINKQIYLQSLISFNKLFQYQPNWANNEFALVLLVKDKLTNLYKINKTYNLSYALNAKNKFGNNIFAEKVLLNDGSSPVYAKVGDISAERPNTSSMLLPKFKNDPLGSNIYPKKEVAGGFEYDGFAYKQGDIQNAQELFSDPEVFDINVLISNELDINGMATIAETRKDCIAVVVPFDYSYLSTNTSNNCTEYLLDNFGSQTYNENKMFGTFGTYSAIYGNMKYQYDKYNDVNRWINIAGDIAGLYSQTDATNDTWWAPAGSTRGVIKNCIKLAFNPNKQNRDNLYVNAINPIMAIAGEGSAIVWGQKTSTAIPSAMDRVNVRRLLIYLEKSIAVAARLGLFEFNDTFTRSRLFGIIDPFLRMVKTKRGLYDYKLVIDNTNNTSQVIDANGLVIDIYLQPTKVAEFINLNMVVVPTGISFNEVIGKYGG